MTWAALEYPDMMVFDLRQAHKGAALNRMCHSLRDPGARDAFRADEEGYMRAAGLTEEQIDALSRRDWLAAVSFGANPYMLMKVGATVGSGLYHQGAQQRGETYEQFLATRQVKGAR